MSEDKDFKDWDLERCNKWLDDPYNQPDPELDDSFDRAFRSSVKRRKNIILKKMEEDNRKV